MPVEIIDLTGPYEPALPTETIDLTVPEPVQPVHPAHPVQPALKRRKVTHPSRPAPRKRKASSIALSSFPVEVIENIFQHVDRYSLKTLARLSPRWNQIINTHFHPLCNTSLGNVSSSEAANYVASCKKVKISHISRVRVSDGFSSKFKKGGLKRLMQSDLQIDSLVMRFGNDVDLDGLSALGTIPQGAFRTLRTLDVGVDIGKMCHLGGFVQCLSGLENLTLRVTPDQKIWVDAGSLNVSGLKMFRFAVEPEARYDKFIPEYAADFLARVTVTNTKKIMMSGFGFYDGDSTLEVMIKDAQPDSVMLDDFEVFLQQFMDGLKDAKVHLRHLRLNGAYESDLRHGDYGGALTRLETLELGQTEGFTWKNVVQLLDTTRGSFKKLSFLTDNRIFGEKSAVSFDQIFEKCPHLEVLDFSNCDNFDDQRCEELARVVSTVKPAALKAVTVCGKYPSIAAVRSLNSALPSQASVQLVCQSY